MLLLFISLVHFRHVGLSKSIITVAAPVGASSRCRCQADGHTHASGDGAPEAAENEKAAACEWRDDRDSGTGSSGSNKRRTEPRRSRHASGARGRPRLCLRHLVGDDEQHDDPGHEFDASAWVGGRLCRLLQHKLTQSLASSSNGTLFVLHKLDCSD